ncbi:hypothetical protein FJT64_013199 [Amphibalanus amphitrite]|uniref:Uncharacterized protein n=1 Tax=Amphibalanus amphitrite TaxID=1232801 RepID=A0A6A4V5H0_AMPAM|nr:hypothetical protein FJT64_013199 [Amphibalanus amphitrite]
MVTVTRRAIATSTSKPGIGLDCASCRSCRLGTGSPVASVDARRPCRGHLRRRCHCRLRRRRPETHHHPGLPAVAAATAAGGQRGGRRADTGPDRWPAGTDCRPAGGQTASAAAGAARAGAYADGAGRAGYAERAHRAARTAGGATGGYSRGTSVGCRSHPADLSGHIPTSAGGGRRGLGRPSCSRRPAGSTQLGRPVARTAALRRTEDAARLQTGAAAGQRRRHRAGQR